MVEFFVANIKIKRTDTPFLSSVDGAWQSEERL